MVKNGYTGSGDPNKPAGIVHMEEFVVTAKALKANPELRGFLESANRGRRDLGTLAIDTFGSLKPIPLERPSLDSRQSDKKELSDINSKLSVLINTTAATGKKYSSRQAVEVEMTPLTLRGNDFYTSMNRTKRRSLRRD